MEIDPTKYFFKLKDSTYNSNRRKKHLFKWHETVSQAYECPSASMRYEDLEIHLSYSILCMSIQFIWITSFIMSDVLHLPFQRISIL